nr:hypothetical protein [Tanacetum cinerariifolium]
MFNQNQGRGNNFNQAPTYQTPTHQPQVVPPVGDFQAYMKANDVVMKNMQTQMTSLTNLNLGIINMFVQFMKMNIASFLGTGSLPSNTVPNPWVDLKVIITRSDVTLAGLLVSPFSSSKEVNREPKTITDQVLTESTNNVPPLVVQPSPASTSFSTISSSKMPEVTKDTLLFFVAFYEGDKEVQLDSDLEKDILSCVLPWKHCVLSSKILHFALEALRFTLEALHFVFKDLAFCLGSTAFYLGSTAFCLQRSCILLWKYCVLSTSKILRFSLKHGVLTTSKILRFALEELHFVHYKDLTFCTDCAFQMHNNIMVAGSRDRPLMLAMGRYAKWQSRFLRYIDTIPNCDALRKFILNGPYTPTTVVVQVVAAIDDSPAVPKHTTLRKYGKLSKGYNKVNPSTFKMSRQTYFGNLPEWLRFVTIVKEEIHLLLTGIGDEIYSTVDAYKTAYEIDPEQAQKDKDMQKNLALIAKYFKKIYKPTNNNLRTSSNSKNKNVDTSQRYKNNNHIGQFGNQRTLTVTEARETVELEAHYSFMAKIKEVPTADSGTDTEPLEQVQYDVEYNMFANERHHFEQPESISNTCVVEKVDSNVIPDSPEMCDNDIQTDQNDVECDDERVVLANIIANLKLDVDENKKI